MLPSRCVLARGGKADPICARLPVEDGTMTKAELIAAIAEKAGLSKNQSRDALEAFLSSVTASAKSGKEVRLVGFGSFVPVARKAGAARNPRTGEMVLKAKSGRRVYRADVSPDQDSEGWSGAFAESRR